MFLPITLPRPLTLRANQCSDGGNVFGYLFQNSPLSQEKAEETHAGKAWKSWGIDPRNHLAVRRQR